ncbi:MAG: RNA dependent RNA polymerase-domain-containing protein, partial [Olpidium bornovanus]
ATPPRFLPVLLPLQVLLQPVERARAAAAPAARSRVRPSGRPRRGRLRPVRSVEARLASAAGVPPPLGDGAVPGRPVAGPTGRRQAAAGKQREAGARSDAARARVEQGLRRRRRGARPRQAGTSPPEQGRPVRHFDRFGPLLVGQAVPARPAAATIQLPLRQAVRGFPDPARERPQTPASRPRQQGQQRSHPVVQRIPHARAVRLALRIPVCQGRRRRRLLRNQRRRTVSAAYSTGIDRRGLGVGCAARAQHKLGNRKVLCENTWPAACLNEANVEVPILLCNRLTRRMSTVMTAITIGRSPTPTRFKQCMTDGCAPISRQILERVQTSLRLDQLPCAVQARLGPSKGVWYLASNEEEEEMATIGGSRAEDGWIKFTPSQKKFCLPDAEPHQSSVLDIVNVACNPKPSALNGGTIRVLESGGIPVSVFLQLQEEQVFRLERRLFSPDVNLVLRELHRYMRMLCNPGDAVTPSNLREAQLVDRCIALICAGATDTDPNVAVSKKIFACNYTRAMLQGMSSADPKLDVARSRYVMMVAPHRFNPLKARQVYCCLTSIDEETGREIGVLKGPLLLARNPCLLPTDVMLVEAVDASELSHLKDVLVMPVQGDRPLASDLAGGDYDGDLVRFWFRGVRPVFRPFSRAGANFC